MRANLISTLSQAADRWPDKVAVVKGDRRFTYRDLQSAVDALAVRLSGAGVRPGDRIGLMFFSSPEAIIAYYAAWQVGAVVVSIAPASKADEVADLADQVEIDVFCYGPQFQRVFPANAAMSRHFDIETSAGCSRYHVQSAALQRSVSPMRQNLLDVNAAAVFFSSGTTSRSKGIVFSHDSLLSRSDNLTEAPAVSESDAILWLQSTANVGSRLHLCLKQGSRIVMADNVDTAPVAALVVEHRITQIYATPMFYRALLAQSDLRAEDFSTVLYFISWSAAVPDLTAEAFRQTFSKEISQSYGLRESGQVFVNFGADIAKRGSVGLP
ncbi:MAG TPA: AMP-binding protein, partial [Candidatus Binatia bacterium]|nr:AMP-binding protein [Candidatus Binatia bacterium]